MVGLCAVVMGQKPATNQAECQQQVTISRKISGLPAAKGVMTGIVLDPLGAVLVGAKVTITDAKTEKAIETDSNNEGRFMVAGLRPGAYEVTVRLPMFKDVEVKNVKLAAGETVTFDRLVLSPQALMGDVVILPEPVPMDRSPSNSVTFSGELIRRLPH
jgi:hypothetical protein